MKKISISACVALVMSSQLLAVDSALIMGIGAGYNGNAASKLPNVDKDISMMTEVAKNLGFKSENTKILKDDEVSKRGINDALQSMINNLSHGDRAFIYFSGHGTRFNNPNYNGACSQAIIPADFHTDTSELVVGEEIQKYVNKIQDKGAEAIVIFDSCHSGKITKSFGGPVSKYTPIGMTKSGATASNCGKAINRSDTAPASKGTFIGDVKTYRYVTMTAARDDEVALSSEDGSGSYFTKALYQELKNSNYSLSFADLRDKTAKTIVDSTLNSTVMPHTPQLFGNKDFFSKPFKDRLFAKNEVAITQQATDASSTIASATVATPASQPQFADTTATQMQKAKTPEEALDALLINSKFTVTIDADKTKLKLRDKIQFTVTSEADGYINLVDVKPDGSFDVLYPNKFKNSTGTNKIVAGKPLVIPKDIGGFDIRAITVGSSRMYAIVTTTEVNFLKNSDIGTVTSGFLSGNATNTNAMKTSLTRGIAAVALEANDDRIAPMAGARMIKFTVTEK